MRVGDILVFTSNSENVYFPYTKGKHYEIFKIDDSFIPEAICGWIKDDNGGSVYFKEKQAEDKDWIYLKKLRRQKLIKLDENRKEYKKQIIWDEEKIRRQLKRTERIKKLNELRLH